MTTLLTDEHIAECTTCGTCRWWVLYSVRAASDNAQYGACHRRAPIAGAYHPGGYTDQVVAETLWPATAEHEFCGERQEKGVPQC